MTDSLIVTTDAELADLSALLSEHERAVAVEVFEGGCAELPRVDAFMRALVECLTRSGYSIGSPVELVQRLRPIEDRAVAVIIADERDAASEVGDRPALAAFLAAVVALASEAMA